MVLDYSKPVQQKPKKKSKLVIVLSIIVILLLLTIGAYFGKQFYDQKLNEKFNDGKIAILNEIKEIGVACEPINLPVSNQTLQLIGTHCFQE